MRIQLIRAVILVVLVALSPDCLPQAQNQPALESSQHSVNTAPTMGGSMVLVRGGTVQMGIDAAQIPGLMKGLNIDVPELFQDEVPKHSVTIEDFYLDKYLVTNSEFKKFTDFNLEWRPDRIPRTLHNGNYLKHWSEQDALKTKTAHPVVNVSWYAAVAYCRWVGNRLPTEAEWEYAARGGLNALFPWGDEPVDATRANFSGSGVHTTSPVGTYPANRFGLFDMAGNVWEFLADEWQPYPSAPQKNPVAGGIRFSDGTSFLQVKTRRVIRGGSFDGEPVNLWVEYRDSHPPDGAREFVGFRCAK
jgi:formylglycine-generating enzyme required for sulfatase activity